MEAYSHARRPLDIYLAQEVMEALLHVFFLRPFIGETCSLDGMRKGSPVLQELEVKAKTIKPPPDGHTRLRHRCIPVCSAFKASPKRPIFALLLAADHALPIPS